MPLVQDTLKTALEQRWLVPEGGAYPADATESGDRFATAVVSWFSAAMAGAFPCSTATARKAQLAAAAQAAFEARSAAGAGGLLATALAAYLAGQLFGTGIAAPPLATSAAGAMIGAVFADLDASSSDRAQRIASACTLLATTTIVTFTSPTPPPPPTPVS